MIFVIKLKQITPQLSYDSDTTIVNQKHSIYYSNISSIRKLKCLKLYFAVGVVITQISLSPKTPQ
jgi:hypothetical protein